MATSSKTEKQGNVGEGAGTQGQRGGSVQRETGGASQGVGSPISNEAYNIISALHAKLEGLEAYRKYAKDATTEIWRDLTQIEMQGVERLVSQLEHIVAEGKLRLQPPGEAH